MLMQPSGYEYKTHTSSKSAFEQMMHEVNSSDSEDEYPSPAAASPFAPTVAESKVSSSGYLVEKEHSTKPSYEWTSNDVAIERFGSYAPDATAGLEGGHSLGTLRSKLIRVLRKEDSPTLCYVERDRSGLNRFQPVFRLYLEAPSGSQRPGTFLCSAKKQSANKTSYYLISMEMDPADRGSDRLLGKLRGNAVGSQYVLYDGGLAPEKTVSPSMLRQELGLIQFNFDSFGPGTIQVWIPSTNAGGGSMTWKPTDKTETIEHAVQQGDVHSLIHLRNKSPKWDEAHGGHVLNFHGRVTESSVKNFQICEQDNEDVSLQFGRVGKHKFTLDVSHPLTVLQAFAICVASMDGKIADRKGYEVINRFRGTQTTEESKSGTTADMRGEQTSRTPSMQYIRDKWRRSFKS